MTKYLFGAVSATALSLMCATGASAADRLNVVASFSIIADFARHVGGDRIELTTIVGPDGDAHAYEPRPQDAAALSKADVILANGANFESFLPRLVETSGSKAPIVELIKGVALIETAHEHEDHAEAGHDHDSHEDHANHDAHDGHDHGPNDPHAFQSAANAAIYVQNIADALCAADAEGCDTYTANAKPYLDELQALQTELTALAASVPAERRTIITSHDAFGYFAKAYNFTFLAAEGLSTEAQPSAANVADLVRQARAQKASAIFLENISDPRLAEQIARETGLTIGGTLYSDALTGPDGAAPSYIEMMRANMQTIVGAAKGS